MCCLPGAAIEGTETGGVIEASGGGGRGRVDASDTGDYGASCSLVTLLTQEHAMRLPGLKRRRLANLLLKAKYATR